MRVFFIKTGQNQKFLLDLRLIFVSLDEVGDPGETGSRDSLLA